MFRIDGVGVILRDFEPNDESAFIAWASDVAMYEYMSWRLDGSDAARSEFWRLCDHPDKLAGPARRHWYLAVTTVDGSFAGITGFDHRRDGVGELGWYLSSAHWGKGHAT